MVKQVCVCADAHLSTSVSSSRFESAQTERQQHRVLAPTAFECELEKSLYFAALSDTRTILKNLAELRASRVSKATVNFLSKHEAFVPLLARLTANYWLTLTEEEKAHRSKIRAQSLALKREKELLDGISVRKKIAKKFFKAHELKKPIRLSHVESAWLDSNPDCRAIVSVKSNFIVPISRDEFDFSEEAFDRLAMRLRFEMLTPNDLCVLKAHGAPVLPDNTLSLNDAAWAREPYAKAVLYRLVKYRKDEQDAQVERIKAASTHIEKPFKRIHLTEDETPSESLTPTRLMPLQRTESVCQKASTPTLAARVQVVQPLKRVELESDEVSCELASVSETSERRWFEEMKEKVRMLFGIPTKMRAFAG
jgi:hypothetical protein